MIESGQPGKHTRLKSNKQVNKRNRIVVEPVGDQMKNEVLVQSGRKPSATRQKQRHHVKAAKKLSPSEPSCVTPVGISVSVEDLLNCPVCIESFDEMELRFYPCPCGYRVCTMCVHLIKEKADGKCPHCRACYSADRGQLLSEIDTQLRLVFDETRRISDELKMKLKPAPKKRVSRRPVFERPDIIVSVAPPVAPPSVPASPQIKLTRFSGGLSVWD